MDLATISAQLWMCVVFVSGSEYYFQVPSQI